ncbi:chromate transporter [Paraclostridium bifermentans]|nr:chromate transporter [Paraclostridium bifermentans]
MLPFIQQEFIDKYHFTTNKEFLDLLALSQSTPGPIAINSATFIGFKAGGFWDL